MIVPTFSYVRLGVYIPTFLHLMHFVHVFVFCYVLNGGKQTFEITLMCVCVCVYAFLHFNFQLLFSSHGTCFKLQAGTLLFKVSKSNMVGVLTYEAVATLATTIIGVWGDLSY
jgi:hypothetical protein